MVTATELLNLLETATNNGWCDPTVLAAILVLILIKCRQELSECSSSSYSSQPSIQSMEQKLHVGQRDGHTRDALLEKELDWLGKEDRGRRLRVDRQTFHKLLFKLHPFMTNAKNGQKISSARRLTATLRFLATSSTLQEIKIDTHISPQMLAKIIVETCECIIEALADYIKCPQSEEEWLRVSMTFERTTRFPSCLGAACARHIELRKVSKADSDYLNERRRPSVLLSAMVDANYEFLLADTCPSGHLSETNPPNRILERKICSATLPCRTDPNQLPYVFVGDDSFKLQENFMVPYRAVNEKGGEANKLYNRQLVRANQRAAKTLAIMAWRFGVLQTPVNLEAKKVQTIVKACCYLHNFFKRESFHYIDSNMEAVIKADMAPIVWGPNTTVVPHFNNCDTDSQYVRDSFSKYFYTLLRAKHS
ncbi:uncharacterized protein LOC126841348 [Adelges cooleyi]|uniref:uncharacterized protein LOC126841348 n=1 Tax=Adelges cooleyi TaxID=133065 RepID=UPI00217FC29C|nr:uncharacterized protein LOC126841348 [Adelges cooleyi]